VQGNTLLKGAEVKALTSPFLGKNRDFSAVQRALEALQAAYKAKGYGSVQVILPEQELEQGVVKFVVIESRIGKVSVQGNKAFGASNIRRSLPMLKEGEPPNTRKIAQSIKVANENPSKQISLLLKSNELVDGEVDATVKVVDDKPWKAILTADNTGNRETGHFRVGAGYVYDNLFDRDQQLSVQYQTSPGHIHDVRIFGAGYHIPLYDWGDSLDFSLGISSVNSGTISLGGTGGPGISVTGSGILSLARYTHNLNRIGDYEHKVIGGLDWRVYRSDLSGIGGNDLAIRPASISYAGNWQPQGQQLNFSVSGSTNWRGARLGHQIDFDASPDPTIHPNYKILRFSADYAKLLPQDWQFRATLDGQWTHDRLVSYEQFGVGGAQSVRGFNEREVAMDKGLRGTLEVYSPDFGNRISEKASLRALGFFDFARVSLNQVNTGEHREGIGSVGVGLRLGLDKKFTLKADLAEAVDGNANGTGTHLTRGGETFLHVGAAYVF
jgi:hemolysin activation/secretion protein